MSAEVVAAIDVGSNSVKLTVACRDSVGRFEPLVESSLVTRLGEGIHLHRLGEPAIRRTLEALREFRAICDRNGCSQIEAVGTSALRDATNQDEFISRAGQVGIPVRAIAGEEEARLSYLAVRRDHLWRNSPLLFVIDIGGGSTELVCGIGSSQVPSSRISLNLGAVRLTEAELRSDPPTVAQMDGAVNAVRASLSAYDVPAGTGDIVGVGGTCTNVAGVHLGVTENFAERIHGTEILASEIELQIAKYASRTIEERKLIPGLNPARADVILAGAIILGQVLNRLNRDRLRVSARGLRWGLLYDRFGD